MVDPLTPAKVVTDQVLEKTVTITKLNISKLSRYLGSDRPWRPGEALSAIRAYQTERVAKKSARKSVGKTHS